ncbi:unnamed protein product [Urochloa decumbens]|uniref:Uncharacterized protein n=1 Tax=Urochloa decumbens TaxID=240449 RepID=A0ABC9HC97_9POAL
MEGGDCDLKKTNEAVMSLEAPPLSGAGGKERKKDSKLVMVKKKLKQEVIDLILKEPFEPLGDDDEDEEVQGMSEPYRVCHAKTRAAFQALAEFDADIIRQYQAKGYAEVDILVTNHNHDHKS